MEDINEIIMNELKQMNESELIKMKQNGNKLLEQSKNLENKSVVKKCIQFNIDLINNRLKEIVNNK
tara:strand:+ start:635 stop:832 length:198 start_codon:yes stop_codon:yes gene_type:complete